MKGKAGNILSYNNSYFYHSFILITIASKEKPKNELTESGKHTILYRNHLTVNTTFSIINDVSIFSHFLLLGYRKAIHEVLP